MITIINFISQALSLLVIIYVILSFIMDPYHPVRRWVDAVVEPMLAPIRRVVPLVGMLDLSPLVLILLISLITNLLISLLR